MASISAFLNPYPLQILIIYHSFRFLHGDPFSTQDLRGLCEHLVFKTYAC